MPLAEIPLCDVGLLTVINCDGQLTTEIPAILLHLQRKQRNSIKTN